MRLKPILMMLLCSFSLGACVSSLSTNNEGQPLAQMTFAHITPSPVYVASYEVVPLEKTQKPYMPVGFVADPADVVNDYLSHRFAASGSTGKLRAVIRNVKVTHEILPSENEIQAKLGLGKRDHYHINIDVDLQSIGTSDETPKSVSMSAKRDIYTPAHFSIIQRERKQMEAIDTLVDDLDIAINNALKTQLHLMH